MKNSTSVQLQLVDAQLSLMEKDYDSAVQTLSSSESISFLPGVVGTIVSILSSRGEKSDEEKQKCDETIDRALKYWKTQKGDEKSLIEILDASASQALELECWSDAASVLESLVQEQKNDSRRSRWLTQLMTAYSYFDISKAESLAKSLPLEQSFESSINAETLERLPVQKINQQVRIVRARSARISINSFFYIFRLRHSNQKNISRIAHLYRKKISRKSSRECKIDCDETSN